MLNFLSYAMGKGAILLTSCKRSSCHAAPLAASRTLTGLHGLETYGAFYIMQISELEYAYNKNLWVVQPDNKTHEPT